MLSVLLAYYLLNSWVWYGFCVYQQLGYVVYRRVLKYYSGEEDGLDMRKAMPRDVEKKSVIPMKRAVTPEELEYD
jgi:N-terminal acetyltransferase B complex catalytic subunit